MKTKKFLCTLLCMLMMIPLVPAASYAATGSDFIVTGDSGYTYSADGTLTFTSPGDYFVSMASAGAVTTTDRIAVNGGTASAPVNITLNDVSIDQSSSTTPCAFELQGTSFVNLTLAGDSKLTSSGIYAGLQEPEGATLTIDGSGSLTAGVPLSASSVGAGIGGGGDTTGGVLTINGGTVKATAFYGAGIGGGEDACDVGVAGGSGGTVTINGGTVTAKSYYHAGIGGGNYGSGGTIIISGGNVTANSGIYGACIGGGSYGIGGSITISGGTVRAVCGNGIYYGAGIGGGDHGSGGSIIISGGTVTAAGSSSLVSGVGGGAGIGGGYCGSGGNVNISGGNVIATGGAEGFSGSEGAGIGAGVSGSNQGFCFITGGSVSVSRMGPTPYCDNTAATPACLTAVTLESVTAATEISSLTASLSGASYSYGINGVRTDAGGRLYLWLPADMITAGAQTASNNYTGSVTTSTDSSISAGMLYLAAAHTITASAGSGGSISPGGVVSVAYDGSQTFSITPANGYSISSVSVDTVSVGAVSSYTFNNVTADHTISASFSPSGGGSSGGSSSYPRDDGTIKVSLTESLLSDAVQKALDEAKESGSEIKVLKIAVKGSGDASGFSLTLPSGALGMMRDGGIGLLQINAPLGDISFDAEVLKQLERQGYGTLSVSVTAVDPSALSAEAKAAIGNRPVYRFTVMIGGTAVSDFGGGTVTVSLPYTPADDEDTDHIIVYYISESGGLVIVPNCVYNAETGMITFTTRHFSVYAIGYNAVSFSDVSGWYENYVQFLAARGVINGTSNAFDPDANITRAQFATILANLSGDDLSGYTETSFNDVKSTAWYFKAVQWAGKNGIARGSDGAFRPNEPVTREQMAAMLYNYANYAGLDVTGVEGMAIREFRDYGNISAWAVTPIRWAMDSGILSGSNRSFSPKADATRAQASKIAALLMQSTIEKKDPGRK